MVGNEERRTPVSSGQQIPSYDHEKANHGKSMLPQGWKSLLIRGESHQTYPKIRPN